jgi:preprotein translocase subunit SecF
MVNLSMNQTLARSINTSLVAILPVFSVLVVGAYILGATTLQNYGLALFVGLVSGAYSSIFIASPLLAYLKEREPRFKELALRVAARSEHHVFTPAGAALLSGEGRQRTPSTATQSATRARPTYITPRPRRQKRR